MNGGKEASEIGTCLFQYLQNLPETVTHVSTYSDTCGGQNCNRFTMTAILYAVQNIDNLQIIDVKYMKSGHSYLEADAMHATIERAKKNKKIYTTREWALPIQMARSKPRPFIVSTNNYSDFYDFQNMASGTFWNRNIESTCEKMKWLKVKWMRFQKSTPFIVQFKYNLSDEKFMELNISPKVQKKASNFIQGGNRLNVSQKYKSILPITDSKKKELLSLLQNGVILKDYEAFYTNIPIVKNKKDKTPWSTSDEEMEV